MATILIFSRTECFLDDIARATGRDPYTFRRGLLAKHPRHLAVLELLPLSAQGIGLV